jgi:hypothetical protein
MREEPVACSSKNNIVSDSGLGAVLAMMRRQNDARSLQQIGLAPQQLGA